MLTKLLFALLTASSLCFPSCSSAYYAAMDKVGIEKRHIVVDRVKEARQSQVAAKEQFATALDAFLSVTDYQDKGLEKTYRKVEANYQRAKKKADAVRARNHSVQRTGKALFREWKRELGTYHDPALARSSQKQYTASKKRFAALTTAMSRAEATLEPVLTKFHDQTLFLKHNLNARAINAVQLQVVRTKSDVAALIKEMEQSIAEADRFIAEMQ